MTAHALTRRHSARRTGLVAAASALCGGLAILAAIAVANLFGGSGTQPATHTYTTSDRAFTVTLPQGWTAVPRAELAKVSGSPAALLRRADGRGLVVVTRIPTVRGSLPAIAKGLTSRLRHRVAGFRLVSARLGHVRGGNAFLYTFVRGAHGSVQSLAITSARGATYRIDSMVAGNAPGVARQAGAIVGSFGP